MTLPSRAQARAALRVAARARRQTRLICWAIKRNKRRDGVRAWSTPMQIEPRRRRWPVILDSTGFQVILFPEPTPEEASLIAAFNAELSADCRQITSAFGVDPRPIGDPSQRLLSPAGEFTEECIEPLLPVIDRALRQGKKAIE